MSQRKSEMTKTEVKRRARREVVQAIRHFADTGDIFGDDEDVSYETEETIRTKIRGIADTLEAKWKVG